MKLKLILFLSVLLPFTPDLNAQTLIKVDSSIHYQTIHGWAAAAQAGQAQQSFSIYRDTLFNRAVHELGINRLSVGITSYTENPVDFFNPSGPEEQWHEIINDNFDPFFIRWSGFQFSSLDDKMTRIVLPFAAKLQAKGERLFFNLTYVDFGQSKFKHKDHPDEYAEFVLAYYLHMQQKFHRVPDAWEVVLEPDNAQWSAEQIASCVLAAGKRLQQHHFTPRFILPSAADMTTSLNLFRSIMENPEILPYIYEFSYHRYSGVTAKALRGIGSATKQTGISSAMLEHIGSGYEDLHRDLKIGNVSSWDQYALAYFGTDDTGGKYYMINAADPLNPEILRGHRTDFLQQYFRYIRMGAVRIEASTTNAKLNPVAFVNRNGKYVVVVKASRAGSFLIQDLPPGTYGITYTTQNEVSVALKDVTTRSGSVSAAIPARGVITIFQKR